MENTKKKLPFGFYVCCLTFSFERLAYYAAKWGLAIFIAAKAVNGGLGLDQSVGAAMSSNLVAFTYITPIIGGYIADRWISLIRTNSTLYSTYSTCSLTSVLSAELLSFHLLERALDTVLCSWFVESSCSSTAYGGSLE